MDSRVLHPDAALPDDPEQLKGMIRELLDLLRTTQRRADGLEHRLDQLLRRLYGPRSERQRPDQPTLFEVEPPTPADPTASNPIPESTDDSASTDQKKKKRRGKPHGRRKLPEHLRRERIVYDLSEAEKICPCCCNPRVKIGEDVSEQYDYVPASLFVKQHVRLKYACSKCGSRGRVATSHPAPGGEGPTPVVGDPLTTVATITTTSVASCEGNVEATTSVAATTATSVPFCEGNAQAVGGNVEPVVSDPPPAPRPSCGIVTAPKPPQPIHKGLPGPGLLAYVAVSKYAHHLPLYRIEQILGSHGGEFSRGTLCGWIAAVAGLLMPLYKLMLSAVLSSRVVQCDETYVKVLEEGLDKTRTARLWTYCGDRQRGRRFVVFDYRPDKSRDGPDEILKGYRGYLQADAANVFDGLFGPDKATEVGCWAHCRRKFHEALTTDALRAASALAQIKEFYKVEDEAKKLIAREGLVGDAADEVRLRLRQEKTVGKLDEFDRWLLKEQINVLPESPMGKAIAYAQRHAVALRRFTEHGFLEIDNNAAERALRPVTVGRKNYLFFGSEEGGKRAAVIYSLTYTCRSLGIDAFNYLRDVLERLPSTPASGHADLLPDRWAQLQRERNRVGD